MIFGIGTDIVEVSRIEEALQRHGDAFARRILTDDEWDVFQLSQTKARFLAKRFAAKEAFAKALGTGLRNPATFQNIGVSHDSLGKPKLIFDTQLQTLLNEKGITQRHLSISDEKALAVAFVVLET
jgi:holo-[acyl-carrier protein] synthase